MNALGGAIRLWRRKRQRGVSPIIATILLVAITVVLAAVLYVLISGLTHSGGNAPYSISMGTPSWSSAYGTIGITGVSGGLKTTSFGFSVTTISGSPVPISTAGAPTNCKAKTAYSTTACTVPTAGWYVVLYYTGNGTIANVWVGTTTATSGAWTSTYAVAIAAGGQSLVIVGSTAAALPSSGDTLNAYGSGSSSVSGTSGSF